MTNYVKRLVFVDSAEKIRINPLIWPFFWSTFFYGFGFAVLGNWDGASKSSLYQSFYELDQRAPLVWGIIALLTAGTAMTLVLTRYQPLGSISAMLGFLLWLFASIVYVEGNFWLPLFTVAIPNMWFWCFYYLRFRWYAHEKRIGLLTDAG